MSATEISYRGHRIYRQSGELFPWRVTWARPDGFSAEPRQFATLQGARDWVDEMADLEEANRAAEAILRGPGQAPN